jgi:hypothetical protein
MITPDLIDGAPEFLQDAATEVAGTLAIVSSAFRELGIPLTAEDAYPYVSLILERADADLALYAEDDGETEEDDA